MHKRIVLLLIPFIIVLIGIVTALIIQKSNNENSINIEGVQKEISLSEVAAHNSKTDCWTYVGGQVFDATKVIAQNTAYATILSSVCGGNGTDVYTVQKYSQQSLTNAEIVKLRESLAMYQIGFLTP